MKASITCAKVTTSVSFFYSSFFFNHESQDEPDGRKYSHHRRHSKYKHWWLQVLCWSLPVRLTSVFRHVLWEYYCWGRRSRISWGENSPCVGFTAVCNSSNSLQLFSGIYLIKSRSDSTATDGNILCILSACVPQFYNFLQSWKDNMHHLLPFDWVVCMANPSNSWSSSFSYHHFILFRSCIRLFLQLSYTFLL